MNEDQVKVFERFAEDIQKQYEAVGIAVSVFDKDKVLYRKNFGYRDLETKAPIDDDTIFGCASISKSFTALSVMQLAEEGKVDINAPLCKYIPEFKDPQDEPVSSATPADSSPCPGSWSSTSPATWASGTTARTSWE